MVSIHRITGGKGNFWIYYNGQDNDSNGIRDTPYL